MVAGSAGRDDQGCLLADGRSDGLLGDPGSPAAGRTDLGSAHEDWRYPLLREGAGRFAPPADLFGIHLSRPLQVFIGCCPCVAVRPGQVMV